MRLNKSLTRAAYFFFKSVCGLAKYISQVGFMGGQGEEKRREIIPHLFVKHHVIILYK